jgi:hypothetical protein
MNGTPFDSGAGTRACSGRALFIIAALVCLLTSQHSARAQDLDEVSFSGVVTDQLGGVTEEPLPNLYS